MPDLTELKKGGRLLELVWQEPQSPKQLSWLVFQELPYQRPRRNSRSTEKPRATGVIRAGRPNLTTETDMHALREESIGLLPQLS